MNTKDEIPACVRTNEVLNGKTAFAPLPRAHDRVNSRAVLRFAAMAGWTWAWMLTRLTRKLRWRAAVMIAVLYAVCSIAPSLALAFADGPTAAHCLTEDHHGVANPAAHDHGDGVIHSHSNDGASSTDGDDGGGAAGKCCGIFCVNALPSSTHLAFGQPVHGSGLMPVLQDHLAGRGPDRIDRPPISSLSL